MREVFLSHASQDHETAHRLRQILIAHGVHVWFSAHHLQGAQQWQDEIGQALARCDWFLLLLTPQAIKSTWVKRELSYALNNRHYDYHIVPLLFQDCDCAELSWTLPQIQMIDFRADYWDAVTALLRLWRKRVNARVRKRFDK